MCSPVNWISRPAPAITARSAPMRPATSSEGLEAGVAPARHHELREARLGQLAHTEVGVPQRGAVAEHGDERQGGGALLLERLFENFRKCRLSTL